MAPDIREALSARQNPIEELVGDHLEQALAAYEPWLDDIGTVPHRTDQRRSTRWRNAARTVVAYRKRYGISDPTAALGPRPRDPAQGLDYTLVKRVLSQLNNSPDPPRQTASFTMPEHRL